MNITLDRIRKLNLNRFGKFCIVGIIAFFINTGFLAFFTEISNLYYIVSAVFAYEISIIANFLMNDNWTFNNIDNKKSNILVRAVNFNMTRITGGILTIFLLFILTELLSINYIISNMISIMIATLFNYSTSIAVVWRN